MYLGVTALIVALSIVFYPVIFGGKILLPLGLLNTMTLPYAENFGESYTYNHFVIDSLLQYYPYKVFTKEALGNFTFAYWNPYILGGYPQYAETMASNFDITNIALLATGMPAAFHLQIFIQLFISGLGMLLLLRSLNISPNTAILFSIAYMLNSMFIHTLLHRWIVGSFCWVPFIIWMARIYLDRRDIKYFFLASVFTALAFMGGNFQTSFFVLVLIFVFHLSYFANGTYSIRSFVQPVTIPTILILSAMALSAVMWAPSLEMFALDIFDEGSNAGEGLSRGLDRTSFLKQLLSIPLLISMYFPDILGNVRAIDLGKLTSASFFEFTAYIGFIPLFFGTLGFFHRLEDNKKSLPFKAIAIIGLVIPFTPLVAWLYYRFFILFIFGATVTGAIYFDQFMSLKLNKDIILKYIRVFSYIFSFLFAGLVMAGIAIHFMRDTLNETLTGLMAHRAAKSMFFAGNESWVFNRADKMLDHFSLFSFDIYIQMLFVTVSLYFIWMYSLGRLSKHFFIIATFFVTLSQLVMSAHSWLPMSNPNSYPLYPTNQVISILNDDRDIYRVLPLYDSSSSKMVFPPNLLSLYGVSTITGYESLFPKTLQSLFKDELDLDDMISERGIDIKTKLLGLCNVKYIIINKEMDLSKHRLELVHNGSVAVYRNLDWRPRAFMVHKYEVINDEKTLLDLFYNEKFDNSVVYLSQEPSESAMNSDPATYKTITITGYAPNSVEIKVNTDKAGYLVLSDTHYPGWKATINGKATEIMVANYVMRAVYIPKGLSTVKFEFKPVSFTAGLAISIATFLLFFAYTIFIQFNRYTVTPKKSSPDA